MIGPPLCARIFVALAYIRDRFAGDTNPTIDNQSAAMPSKRYIETVFETLQVAVDFGVIQGWSVDESNFVIHHGSEQTTVPSLKAADYLIDLFRQHDKRIITKATETTAS